MTEQHARPIRVLQLLADPDRTGRPVENPYTTLLIESLPADRIHTRYFRWRGVLGERFDVLHVHWPENSLRHPRPLGRAVKAALFALFLARIALQRKAVVRTLHNVEPHERGSGVERRLLRRLDALTTLWITLNETTPTPDPSRTVLIPHGHYREWYRPDAAARPVPGRLLNIGMIRPYKGTEELVTAFRGIDPDAGLSLHIVGAPEHRSTAETLAVLAGADPRVRLDLRFVDDQTLADEVAEAEIVVLPYRVMHNSGAALLALSLDRPVIVPSSPATALLAAEVGEGWVTRFDGRLDAPALSALVEQVRSSPRSARPDLSARDWSALAGQLVAAYETALRLTGRPVAGGAPAATR